MHFFRGVMLAVLGSVGVAAVAVPKPLSENRITIGQVSKSDVHHYEGYFPHDGLTCYAKAISKYGASEEHVAYFHDLAKRYGKSVVPSNDRREVEDSDDDGCSSGPETSGPLLTTPNNYDGQYVSQISIGGLSYWVDFDTGSSDFWVFGPNVTGLQANQTVWEPSSASKQLSGESWWVSYGDGSMATGSVWTDEVELGAVKIPNASVEVADFAMGTFDAPSSGILGLGFDNLNSVKPVQQKTIFTTLITSGLISSPVLSADLKHGAPGSYTFGDIPQEQYSGEITYTSADSSKGFWMIEPLRCGASGTSMPPSANSSLRGIVDTGTTLILMDDASVAGYWGNVPGAVLDLEIYGGWVFECGQTLPDFELVVGDVGGATYTVTVPAAYMSFEPIKYGKCYGALQPLYGQVPFNIFGDVLLKSAFVVFDRGTGSEGPRVGFADKKGQ